MSNNQPSEWQTNPENVETANVQFWRNGVMVTAQMTRQEAQEMVENGEAFVMTGQAVGSMTNGQRNS